MGIANPEVLPTDDFFVAGTVRIVEPCPLRPARPQDGRTPEAASRARLGNTGSLAFYWSRMLLQGRRLDCLKATKDATIH